MYYKNYVVSLATKNIRKQMHKLYMLEITCEITWIFISLIANKIKVKYSESDVRLALNFTQGNHCIRYYFDGLFLDDSLSRRY